MNKLVQPRPFLAFLVVSHASLPGYWLQERERALGMHQQDTLPDCARGAWWLCRQAAECMGWVN